MPKKIDRTIEIEVGKRMLDDARREIAMNRIKIRFAEREADPVKSESGRAIIGVLQAKNRWLEGLESFLAEEYGE